MKQAHITTIKTLLTPSWLSGFLDGMVWIVLVLAGLLSTHFVGSQWQQGLFNLGSSSSSTYHQLTGHVKDNRLISNLPLLIFWIGIGFIIYYLAIGLYQTFHSAVELREELEYVHARRRERLRNVLEQLAVRCVSLAIWVVYTVFFFRQLVPYTLSALRSLGAVYSSHNLEQGVLAAIAFLLGLHLHTILFRLITLRQRVFSSVVYN
ncbi:MAG TPA: hypothetical protein VG992_03515 [Candidatus Saccharimonadales bacterium]|nr:hypothetical protein [Candidatus Saccharimonadales bacterium]